MADNDNDIVLELRNLYVGYYKDLNILPVSYTHLTLPTICSV